MGLGLPLLRLAARSRPAVPCRLKVRWGSVPPSPPFLSPRIDCPPVEASRHDHPAHPGRAGAGTALYAPEGDALARLDTEELHAGLAGTLLAEPELILWIGITYRNREALIQEQKGCKTMKSLAELQAIRDKMRQQIDLRDSGRPHPWPPAASRRAPGPCSTAFLEEVDKRDLKKRHRSPRRAASACAGWSPFVEVYARPGEGHLCEDDPGQGARHRQRASGQRPRGDRVHHRRGEKGGQ